MKGRRGRTAVVAMTGLALLATGAGPVYAETADDPVPLAPRVTSLGPYSECTANACVGEGGPGMPGRFSIVPNPVDTDVTGYRVHLVGGPVYEVSAEEAASVEVVPSQAGPITLRVEAKDRGLRYGPAAVFVFKVKPVEQAGRWRFDDGLADPASTVAKDSAPVAEPHDAIVHAYGETWSPLARRGAQDRSLLLDRTPVGRPAEYAATSAPVVNTDQSFTVSAWAYLGDRTADRVVLSAGGKQDSAFALYYSAADKKWAFRRAAQDAAGTTSARSLADTANPPVNVWTHVAGVFDTKYDADPSNDTVQLYVNGHPQGEPVVVATVAPAYEPWRATSGLQFGRGRTAGAYGQYFRGRVDEVTAYQWALGEEALRAEAVADEEGQPAVVLAGHWDATVSKGSRIEQRSPYPARAMELSPTGATLQSNGGGLALDGKSGYARVGGPVVDETGSFTVSARVRLDSVAMESKPVGYRAQVAGQSAAAGASWGLWVTKYGPGIHLWQFSRTAAGTDGTAGETVTVGAEEMAEMDTWVDITGVFDAQPTWGSGKEGEITLYVGPSGQRRSEFGAPQQGTGALTVGSESGTSAFLPGGLKSLRVWTGAMTAHQVATEVAGQ
ncbi:LamG-like jellyroll fold domain-containing protein [Streptomyces sp. NPDC093546]|uniref:LamG domain-containing protein n=1 Tax=Streptomyces sp. NPDC093546 TaxID=3366040 RepID=UPI0038207CC6